jgi:hypothetical protein
MFKIKIPVGMPYRWTIAYSTYDRYEIILPPGTKLIIESWCTRGNWYNITRQRYLLTTMMLPQSMAKHAYYPKSLHRNFALGVLYYHFNRIVAALDIPLNIRVQRQRKPLSGQVGVFVIVLYFSALFCLPGLPLDPERVVARFIVDRLVTRTNSGRHQIPESPRAIEVGRPVDGYVPARDLVRDRSSPITVKVC